ncbi:MAG TPA: helicase-associated domain-containing protein, partial [Candidatus Hydrogenedentes bacterium]|nr:helicase-associated domain-containing protein [Candidatus Hydrogenedentota bacterium]
MPNGNEKPVIVQSDRSVLLETDGPMFEDARDSLAAFAELVKSPEHIHTYRITPLSLWNAAAAGFTAAEILDGLARYSKYDIPQNIIAEIEDNIGRYGRLKLYKSSDGPLVLESEDPLLIMELLNHK